MWIHNDSSQLKSYGKSNTNTELRNRLCPRWDQMPEGTRRYDMNQSTMLQQNTPVWWNWNAAICETVQINKDEWINITFNKPPTKSIYSKNSSSANISLAVQFNTPSYTLSTTTQSFQSFLMLALISDRLFFWKHLNPRKAQWQALLSVFLSTHFSTSVRTSSASRPWASWWTRLSTSGPSVSSNSCILLNTHLM